MRRLLLVAIGIIGALGQTLILRHTLIESYPYKVMSNPSGTFYAKVALAGSILSLLVAIIVGKLAAKSWRWVTAVICFAAPAGFLIAFTLFSLLYGVNWHSTENIDRVTPMNVLAEFALRCFELQIVGGGIGLLIGLLIGCLPVRRDAMS